jgi:hypothetical protein
MKKSLLFILLLGNMLSAYAQDDIFGLDTKARDRSRKSKSDLGNVTRNAISLVSFEISGGGSYLFNDMIFRSDAPLQYPISQYLELERPVGITPEDTLNIYSNGTAYPINIAAKLNLFNALTIGGGYGREIGNMGSLRGGPYELSFAQPNYTFDKAYGSFGLVLYDSRKRAKFLSWKYRRFAAENYAMQSELKQGVRFNYPWRFLLEGDFGKVYIRRAFDPMAIMTDQPFYSINFRVEREFSEYAKLFIKTGMETRQLQFLSKESSDYQNLKQTLYGMQVGLSINMPGTKRCKHRGCAVVMKHLHDGVEYRGSSIFNLQNRKVGQWY